jgi:hypothetical protein
VILIGRFLNLWYILGIIGQPYLIRQSSRIGIRVNQNELLE